MNICIREKVYMESLPTIVQSLHSDGHRTGCLRSCGQTESSLTVHVTCAGHTGPRHTKYWCVRPISVPEGAQWRQFRSTALRDAGAEPFHLNVCDRRERR